MTSYAVDTNVLLGYSYLQNRWQKHTQRLFQSDNTVVAPDQTIFEYCCRRSNNSKSEVNLDWSKNDGLFAIIKADLRDDAFLVEQELDARDEEVLDPYTVAQIFIDEHDVEEQVEERILRFFRAELSANCDRTDARDAVRDLVERITTVADKRKRKLTQRVKHHSEGRDPELTKNIADLISGHGSKEHPDANVVSEVKMLKEAGKASSLVTGDKNDIYSNSERIQATCSLPILYLKDEFADHELPQS